MVGVGSRDSMCTVSIAKWCTAISDICVMRIRIRSAHDADPNPAQGCGSLSGTMMRIRIMHNDADPFLCTKMRIRIMHKDADPFFCTKLRIRIMHKDADPYPAQWCGSVSNTMMQIHTMQCTLQDDADPFHAQWYGTVSCTVMRIHFSAHDTDPLSTEKCGFLSGTFMRIYVCIVHSTYVAKLWISIHTTMRLWMRNVCVRD